MKKLIPLMGLLCLTGFSCTMHNTDKSSNIKHNSKSLSVVYIDSSIKPGDNFYLFANGKWIDTAKIPLTESRIGSALECIISQNCI